MGILVFSRYNPDSGRAASHPVIAAAHSRLVSILEFPKKISSA